VITKAFTGCAGTGKTTNLLHELEEYLAVQPLSADQRVLALTFMHGSRHRLADRLARSSARRRYDCMTLDHFAWELCRRWRARLRARGCLISFDPNTTSFDAVCEAAGKLLACPDVLEWVVRRYPVIIIDEVQDCAPVRLALAKHFHGRVRMLVAGDDFQNLNRNDECPATIWLRELGIGQDLTVNHRTADAHLMAAAHALRQGTTLIPGTSTSLKIISCPAPAIAASFISQTMAPVSGKDVVLLSAARRENSDWVNQVIEFVATRTYGSPRVGPIKIHWEMTTERLTDEAIAALAIGNGDIEVKLAAILGLPQGPIARQMNRWAEHQRRVLGRTSFCAACYDDPPGKEPRVPSRDRTLAI